MVRNFMFVSVLLMFVGIAAASAGQFVVIEFDRSDAAARFHR